MPIVRNQLSEDLTFLSDTEQEVTIPGATEAHDEEGRLIATCGSVEITDEQWSALNDDEEAFPYINDGAIYLYVPELVEQASEASTEVQTEAAPEEQAGGTE